MESSVTHLTLWDEIWSRD